MRAPPGRETPSTLSEPADVTRDEVRRAQRRRIIRATAELVAKRGYNGVTVELIVKRAKVSYKTFYAHFGNRQEVFLSLFDSAAALTLSSMREAAAEAGDSWPAQVDAALRALLELIAADPATARACLVESLTAGPVFVERYQRALRGLAPLLERGRELSARADDLPATLEDTVAGAITWFVYQRLVVNEIEELRAQRPEILEFVLRPYMGEVEARSKRSPQPPVRL
jgi:AcrR family transcriptional regulator